MTADGKKPTSRRFPGRSIVLGMFAFAAVATAFLWFYWTLHLAPFKPLQLKIAERFPESWPRVEGGQRKIHKSTTPTLRITMSAGFDPTVESKPKAALTRQVCEFLADWQDAAPERPPNEDARLDLNRYEIVELYLYLRRPEQPEINDKQVLDMPDILARKSVSGRHSK